MTTIKTTAGKIYKESVIFYCSSLLLLLLLPWHNFSLIFFCSGFSKYFTVIQKATLRRHNLNSNRKKILFVHAFLYRRKLNNKEGCGDSYTIVHTRRDLEETATVVEIVQSSIRSFFRYVWYFIPSSILTANFVIVLLF